MRCSRALLLLATVAIGHAAAGVVHRQHVHIHEKKNLALDIDAQAQAAVEKRDLEKRDLVIVTQWVTKYEPPTPTTTPVAVDVKVTTPPVPTTTSAAAAAPTTARTSAAPPVVAVAATTSAAPVVATSAAPVAAVAPATGGSSSTLSDADLGKLKSMGVAGAGINAGSNNGNAWLGTDGPYTNKFINGAGVAVILVLWGDWGSWVNVKQPVITISLPPGASTTVSMVDGFSGAWAGVYPDTTLVNGQVSNVWGEITTGFYGVYDVSYEPKMSGHPMSIVGPKCTSDATRCVFKCTGGTDTCTFGYDLFNCAAGSQVGAQYGTFAGAASGGCGFFANNAAITTTFL